MYIYIYLITFLQKKNIYRSYELRDKTSRIGDSCDFIRSMPSFPLSRSSQNILDKCSSKNYFQANKRQERWKVTMLRSFRKPNKMEKEAKHPDSQTSAFPLYRQRITTLPFIKENFSFYLEESRVQLSLWGLVWFSHTPQGDKRHVLISLFMELLQCWIIALWCTEMPFRGGTLLFIFRKGMIKQGKIIIFWTHET